MRAFHLGRRVRRHFVKAGERGAEAIEFAFVFPVVVVMFLCLVEGGRAFWINNAISQAIYETGRYAMIHIDAADATIQGNFSSHLTGVDPADVTVTVSTDATGETAFTTISATYQFVPLSGYLGVVTFPLSNSTRVPRT